ncbi:hypothetical protein LINPERHAP2_LOCUS33740 [Linum perenne]
MENSGSFEKLVVAVLDGSNETTLAEIMAIMWAILRERNARIWRQQSGTARGVIKGAKETLQEWITVQEQRRMRHGAVRMESCSSWHPPEVGKYKMNLDATVFANQWRIGIDLCLKDHTEAVQSCKMLHRRGTQAASFHFWENTALGNVLSIALQVFDESPLPNLTAQMDKPLQAFEPPMFSGDSDPCSWLEACVRYFRVSKVPANEMVDEAGWYLENKAYFWFLDWENGRFSIPWDEFSQAISCRFASLTPNPMTETLAMEPGIVCATLSYSSTRHICVDKASSKLLPIHSSLLHTNPHLKREWSTPHTL